MTRKRQLVLPCLRRATPEFCAVPDLNASQFADALKRNGFQPSTGGLHCFDTTEQKAGLFEFEYRTNPVRVDRRATLAKIIREREERAR